MAAATRDSNQTPRRVCRTARWLGLSWVLILASSFSRAQAPDFREGLFIAVRSPITSERVNRIKSTAERAIHRPDRPVRTLVFDFNPGRQGEGAASFTQEYGPCADLAEYLLELPNAVRDVTTVAFVHNDVTGHTVLPVLACNDVVLSADAHLGAVLRDQPGRLRKDKEEFYLEVARARGRPTAIVIKMLDRDAEIVEGVRVGGGVVYIDGRRRQDEAKRGIIVNQPEPLPGLEAGNLALYSAADARKFGLCNLIKDSRRELAEEYQLAPSSLRQDPLEGREPVAERIIIREPITRGLKETLERLIPQAIARKANVIVLQLESRGGDTQVGRDIAEFLRELKDDRGEYPVMTIAYIPQQAPDAATFVAFGCSEIVMGRHAEIGDFENVVYQRRGNGRIEIDPEQYLAIRDSLVGLADEQGYAPLLARGMLDRSVTIYRVQSQKGQARWRLLTEEELAADRDGPREWGDQKLIKAGAPRGKFLKLSADDARQLGVAREIADSPQDLYRLYGLDNVRDSGADFLYEFARILRHPVAAVLLMMIGVSCLFLELKMAGVGLPGVIAALCFILYFWSQSQLAGQITMLAVLLFVLGLILLALEVFLLPGLGVTGISGIVLIVVSLALATLQKKPETTQEWLGFGRSVGTVGVSLFGAICLAALVGWYLPHIPYANRLFLKRPGEAEEQEFELGNDIQGFDRSTLLGITGVAETDLRPAGLARFGDELVDVVSEGSFVYAGSRIQVVEIEGNRVVVKEEI